MRRRAEKKKKKSKAKKAPITSAAAAALQSEPPRIPVSTFFKNNVYPIGEIQEYIGECVDPLDEVWEDWDAK